MATNTTVMETVDSSEAPASLMPRLGETIRIPGLDNLGNVAPETLDISDFGCHDSNVPSPCAPQECSSTEEHESALIDAINTPLAPVNTDDMEPPSDSVVQESNQEEQHPEGLELAEQAANYEWQRQSMTFHEHKDIHHFNFFGYGMPCKNATPPAVSLFVAARGAKAALAQCETNPHRYAVLWNAAMQIDPVIYHGPADQLDLRGERLREAVTGACEKFYSEHGTWRLDEYGEEEDQPSLDKMEVLDYRLESLPANGWFLNGRAMDRDGFFTRCSAMANAEEILRKEACGYGYKKEWQRRDSPLSQMAMVEDLDAAEENETKTIKAPTPLESSNVTKKFEVKWTVDLDKYLGKCDNWADELDGDDGHSYGQTPASSQEVSSCTAVQSDVADEPEDDQELEQASTSAQSSSNVTIADSLPGSTAASDTSFFDEDSEEDEIPSPTSTSQPEVLHDLIIPSQADVDEVDKSGNELAQEELRAEDKEVYGKAPVISPDVSLLLQQLRNSGLITSRNEAFSDSGSSDEGEDSQVDEDESTSSQTSISEASFLGGTFSLLIRQKPRASWQKPQTLSNTFSSADSSQISPSSFSLPIRVKSSVSVKGSKHSTVPSAIYNDIDKDNEASGSEAKASANRPVRPTTPRPWRDSLSAGDDEEDTASNEQISPISPKSLSHANAPLKPQKRPLWRLAETPVDLAGTSLEPWPEADESDAAEGSSSKQASGSENEPSRTVKDVFDLAVVSREQMLKRFNDVDQSPSLKRPRISRSFSFPNLALQKAGEAAKAHRSPRRRHSSLRYRKTVDKLDAIVEQDESGNSPETAPKESETLETMSPAIVDNNSDEDMSNIFWADMAKSSRWDEKKKAVLVEDNDFPLVMPLASPYKRPESNTPLKMRGRRIRLDLPDDVKSDDSVGDTKPQTAIPADALPTEGSSEPFIYALDNWNNIFELEPNNPYASVSTPIIILADVPFLVSPLPLSPPSTIGTASNATSPLLLPIEIHSPSTSSSSSSQQQTTSSNSSAGPRRSVKDVKFNRVRPPKTVWGKIKEKLGKIEMVGNVKQKLRLSGSGEGKSEVDKGEIETGSEVSAKTKENKKKGKGVGKSIRKSLKMGFVECFVDKGAFEGD